MSQFLITESFVRKLLETVDAGLMVSDGVPKPGKLCVEAAIYYALSEPHSKGSGCVDPIVRRGLGRLNDALWSSKQARAKGLRKVAIAQLGSKDTINITNFLALFAEYTIREVVPVALRAAGALNSHHTKELEAHAEQCEREGSRDVADAAARAAYDARIAAYSTHATHASGDAAYVAFSAARAATYAACAATYIYHEGYANRVITDSVSAAYAAADAAAAAVSRVTSPEADHVFSLCANLMVRALQKCGSPGCEWLWLVDQTEVTA